MGAPNDNSGPNDGKCPRGAALVACRYQGEGAPGKAPMLAPVRGQCARPTNERRDGRSPGSPIVAFWPPSRRCLQWPVGRKLPAYSCGYSLGITPSSLVAALPGSTICVHCRKIVRHVSTHAISPFIKGQFGIRLAGVHKRNHFGGRIQAKRPDLDIYPAPEKDASLLRARDISHDARRKGPMNVGFFPVSSTIWS